jgi:hypothetical protein
MATIAIKYVGLTGQKYDLNIDNGQTFTQLRTAIASNEGLSAGDYENVALLENTSKSYVDTPSVTLATAGAVANSIFICKGLTTGTKEAKQVSKLDVAQEKRQADSDTNAVFYRPLNTYNINLLPTKYNGNDLTDNANSGGLVDGRPWE